MKRIAKFSKVSFEEFYNGMIQGKKVASAGIITNIRNGCKIEKTSLEENESIYLSENLENE